MIAADSKVKKTMKANKQASTEHASISFQTIYSEQNELVERDKI